jgi:hypothetical protein
MKSGGYSMIDETISFRGTVLDVFISVASEYKTKEAIDEMVLSWVQEIKVNNRSIWRTSAINKIIKKIEIVKQYGTLTYNTSLEKRCNAYIELFITVFDHYTITKRTRLIKHFFHQI